MNGRARSSKSETKVAVYEEKKQRFRTEDATVEVTVKLKKRSDKPRSTNHRGDHYGLADSLKCPPGSWGDIFMRQKQKRLAESQTSLNQGELVEAPDRVVNGNALDNIRIVAQVPRENKLDHTRKKSIKEKHYQQSSAFMKEHSRGHGCHEVDNFAGLRVQVPASKSSSTRCCEACTCHKHQPLQRVKDVESQTSFVVPLVSGKIGKSPPTKEREPSARMTTTLEDLRNIASAPADKAETCKSCTIKRSEIITVRRFEDAEVQTKDKGVSTVIREAEDIEHTKLLQDLKKLSALEQENLLLKQNTNKLLEQVEKSKTERQEYITTIKELYELAEVLRHENVILIGTHEEHRTLQEKLSEALGENQVLKKHLDELSTRISQSTIDKSKDNDIRDFWKVRDVLKEVKSAISEEINGLQQANGRNTPSQIDESDILELFGRTKDCKEMNDDTNTQCDDEIQKILNGSKEIADRSDIRSSTQYLDVEDGEIPASCGQRNYVPSPVSEPSSL